MGFDLHGLYVFIFYCACFIGHAGDHQYPTDQVATKSHLFMMNQEILDQVLRSKKSWAYSW